MNVNTTNNVANNSTLGPANFLQVPTFVDNAKHTTSYVQNTSLRRHFTCCYRSLKSVQQQEIYTDSNPNQSKFFLATIKAKDLHHEIHLSNKPPTLSINLLKIVKLNFGPQISTKKHIWLILKLTQVLK